MAQGMLYDNWSDNADCKRRKVLTDAAPMLKMQASSDICRNEPKVILASVVDVEVCSAAREVCGSAEGG